MSSRSGEEISARRGWRDRALRRVVSSAYRRVPYYRELYQRHGVASEEIRGLGDLARLPLAEKRAMREAGAAGCIVQGRDPRSLVAHNTHGSTGEPFTVYRSWREERWLQLFRWRTLLRWGWRPNDRKIEIHSLSFHSIGSSNRPQAALARLGLFRLKELDCLSPPEELVAELMRRRPQIISGYPVTLAAVARVLKTTGVSLPALRFVVAGGEALTAPTRRLISQVFGAPVHASYGAHELNEIAWRCPRSGELHVNQGALILEVLKDGRPALPGEPGEVVCTALWSYTMPFIRYRLGDVAVLADGPCACGRPGLRLRSVAGRSVDLFELPDGRQIHPYEITDHALDLDWITQYQLLQERRDRVVVTLVAGRPVDGNERAQLALSLRRVLGRGVECELVFRDFIPPDPGGKCATYRSLVTRAVRATDASLDSAPAA